MRYTLRQLEVFVAVGRFESVSRATEALNLSQSATSTALAELEKQFDVRLFDRHGKRLQLNESGRALLPRAIELLDRAGEIESLLAGKAGLNGFRFGATLTIGNYLATLLVGEFMRRHPGCRVQLDVHNTSTILRQVAHFELDFGLIEGDNPNPDLCAEPWVADELVVFAAPDHPLTREAHVTVEMLAKQPWIVREPGSGTRQAFESAFHSVRAQMDVRLELEHTEAIKRAVEAGMGLSCISRLALKEAFRRGSLVPIEVDDLNLERQFHIVWHKQKFHTPGMQAFIALCREVSAGATRADEIIMRDANGREIEYR
ncbi:transcriptional regulator [Jeongeupia sp. HS-3]|uniref:LysR family transcriptional regulator n=1 Tax=Jeongeupia sp. HS-3 TaxID=1009682 RepID=UPI0018A53718|nr:LysR family transcriptional regulator [Jeongeupia sp. HS-3]BCL76259.1 transcriptional regulator [Jeongeupia sp. HS-3]